MILAMLHLFACGTPQVPEALPIPTGIETSRVPAAVQVSETHFLARSFVDDMQWLVFANEELGLLRVRGLYPHSVMLLPIVAGAAEGVSVEVVAQGTTSQLMASGSISIDALASKETVFFEDAQDGLVAWVPRHEGRSLTRLQGEKSTLLPTQEPNRTAGGAATHVPVPTPAENRKRNKGRKLGKKKLPPI